MARKRKLLPQSGRAPWDDLPPEVQAMLISILPLAEDTTVVDRFQLNAGERERAQSIPGLSPDLQRRLAQANVKFTIGDTVQLLATVACGLAMLDGEMKFLESLVKKLGLTLNANLDQISSVQTRVDDDQAPQMPHVRQAVRPRGGATHVYQLKIELTEYEPTIWRRIEVEDCTLATLHEHIQTAMGWTNSHMHQFYVGKQIYADPAFQEVGFGVPTRDSTTTWLSDLLQRRRSQFSFEYEYDFGDSWRHRITFENKLAVDPAVKYPRCVAGEQACPPEDCGGTYGYAELLRVLSDPEDEEYDDMRDWVDDGFDPAAFDPVTATQAMQAGMPELIDPAE